MSASALAALLVAAIQVPPVAASPDDAPPPPRASGGDAMMYIGTYDEAIYVIDEATEAVTGRIALQTGIPRSMRLSHDRSRFYVLDVSYENVEVVDIASRRSLDTFTLSEGDRTVRIWGLEVEPSERWALLLTKSYTRLPDRFEVSEPTLLRYDLQAHRVMDTIPWPDGRVRENVSVLFSPDGELVYFFSDDLMVLETDGFTQVDRWEYARALDDGMGAFDFGFPEQTYEEPGFYTGLFRVEDPVNDREILGVARVDLAERDVDFFTVGPSASVGFTLAPGGRRAYGIHNEVANYQFWTFDLEGRRVETHGRFRGRPRTALMTSSNGRHLYVYNAGNTIDLYDAATYRYLRTLELDADTTTPLFVLPPGP